MTEQELKNKELVEKYPFLSWYGNPLFRGYSEDQISYKRTWEDELPEGWRKAFCPQMWGELKNILEKANYVDEFSFRQIKEKYGTLRLYYCSLPAEIYDEVSAWEFKYEKLSEKYCINCGKPAKYMTLGWISFVCEDCEKEVNSRCIPSEDIEEFYKDPEKYLKK